MRQNPMLRKATDKDFEDIFNIINDAAIAYKGVIPGDRWHDPYMPKEELQKQIEDGVEFLCYIHPDEMMGVMGIQDKGPVTLIRHAYVRTRQRNQGIGTLLLQALIKDVTKPVLIGTWQAAHWAVRFYEKNGFCLVDAPEKDRLLRAYWAIPERQVETSVVLANEHYSRARNEILSSLGA